MNITIHNIGIIKDADILVDGLTVITGKNSSGKTTVGKLAYSLVKANSNAEESFDSSKETYVETQLEKLRRLLSPTSYPLTSGLVSRMRRSDNEDELAILFSREYRMKDFEDNYQLISRILKRMYSLKAEDILAFVTNQEYDNDLIQIHIKRYQEQFDDIKERAIEACKKTIETLESENSYQAYLHQRTKDFLIYHFNNQIKPVRNKRGISGVTVTQKGNKCIGIKIKANNNFVYDSASSFVFPATQTVFLDDPFALDRIADEDSRITGTSNRYRTFDDQIHPTDLQSYSVELKYMLLSKKSSNFFDEMELQRKYHPLFEKINAIVPGDLQITEDGFFYLHDGIKLDIHNLATGSKLFFIIKRLLLNGYLDDTLLVLDEPESHLHPEWIQKFAEIITLLVKELRVKIILTTHSPDLLLALSVYTKDYGINDISHYYLAKAIEGSWEATIDRIDQDINEGYAHLSIPLLKMSVRNQQQIKEKSNDR